MARQRRRLHEEKQSLDRLGVVLLGSFAFLIVSVGIFWFQYQPVQTDASNCPKGGATNFTVVLVDVTDAVTPVQAQALRNAFEAIRNDVVPVHGSLELFAVEGDGSKLLSRRVALCKPEREGSEYIRNVRRLERAWHERYQMPLDEALETAASSGSASRSPIMEAIQSVAVASLQLPSRERATKTLIVVSDFLQNTDQVSFYKRVPDAAAFIASTEFRRLQADLRGVNVILVQIERPDDPDERQVMELWRRIIIAEGAEVGCFKTLMALKKSDLMKCRASDGEFQ